MHKFDKSDLSSFILNLDLSKMDFSNIDNYEKMFNTTNKDLNVKEFIKID